jgi:hypothetical protein
LGEGFEIEAGRGKHTARFVYSGCPASVNIEFWRMDGKESCF